MMFPQKIFRMRLPGEHTLAEIWVCLTTKAMKRATGATCKLFFVVSFVVKFLQWSLYAYS
ncbi:hypothetical protein D3OALGA1CA_3022 [Olavius algarvensis associated proteobacterium Delta 3]|nr:hypothetical protein D3OALGA1CA_3022 [Olavius algarvensis associated proteobacterium Delta 3]CAB5157469.1 hypothetical protein D3OALGB2SA_5202 [Olavius algarvensis associated proteobacterium Delta 3]